MGRRRASSPDDYTTLADDVAALRGRGIRDPAFRAPRWCDIRAMFWGAPLAAAWDRIADSLRRRRARGRSRSRKGSSPLGDLGMRRARRSARRSGTSRPSNLGDRRAKPLPGRSSCLAFCSGSSCRSRHTGRHSTLPHLRTDDIETEQVFASSAVRANLAPVLVTRRRLPATRARPQWNPDSRSNGNRRPSLCDARRPVVRRRLLPPDCWLRG